MHKRLFAIDPGLQIFKFILAIARVSLKRSKQRYLCTLLRQVISYRALNSRQDVDRLKKGHPEGLTSK